MLPACADLIFVPVQAQETYAGKRLFNTVVAGEKKNDNSGEKEKDTRRVTDKGKVALDDGMQHCVRCCQSKREEPRVTD